MAGSVCLRGGNHQPARGRSYSFQVGPLHYRVLSSCGKQGGRTFTNVELVLVSVDYEPHDPNLNYDVLKEMENYRYQTASLIPVYGITKGTSYAFRVLATLASILRDIIKDENPDEFRCVFLDVIHSPCWEKYVKYIARPTSAVRKITSKPAPFGSSGVEWTISLNK